MEVGTAERYASGGPGSEPTAENVYAAFCTTAARLGDDVAIRTADDSVAWSWNEVAAKVKRIAGGLAGLGLQKGDTVALLLDNRPEFIPCDLAAVSLGGVPFSIYQTSSPEQIAFVTGDAAREDRPDRERLPRSLPGGGAGAARCRAHSRRRRRRGNRRRWRSSRRRIRASIPPSTQGRPRRPADPDLHLGHDRAAEGSAAHPPQPDGADQLGRAHDRPARERRQGHLLAPRRPHRRAGRALLPAGRATGCR